MKKFLIAVFSLVCCLSLDARIKYDSFEDGVPEHWQLQGSGKLSTNQWHYKLGKKSLQWDFAAGDVIRVNNTLGNINARGARNNICYSTFGIWIYCEKAMPGKSLRFEFREDEKDGAYFDFPLNFSGWQCAFVKYKNVYKKLLFSRNVSPKTNNILIKAPEDIAGRVLIDSVIYNELSYYWFNFLPRKTPWEPPKIDEGKFPVPQKVSAADMNTIEKIKPKAAVGHRGEKYYRQATALLKKLNITEDAHGIRGMPIVLPRGMSNGPADVMFIDAGIDFDKLIDFTRTIVIGDNKARRRGGDAIAVMMERSLTSGVSRKQYKHLNSEHVKLWKYLLDQGFNCSYNDVAYNARFNKILLRLAVLLREGLHKNKLMAQVWDFLQCPLYALFEPENSHVSMDYFLGAKSLYDQVFLYSNDPHKQLQALRFLSDRLSREITGDYGAFGFKPDGCGYHCTTFSLDYMQGGLLGISKMVRSCAGTSFAFSDAAYNRLKLVALRGYFYSNSAGVPIFLQGTDPFFKFPFFALFATLKNLALAGKNGCDKALAQAYVNLKPSMLKMKRYDPVFEQKYGIKPSPLPQGNISMPYAPLTAQRRADWVAVAWGGKVDMRDRGNQYMYHGGNGPLEILGKGGLFASGNQKAGWDWNRTNGTTVLYMPEIIDIKYAHSRKAPKGKISLAKSMRKRFWGTKKDPKIIRGDGGISWRGKNGTFRKIFRGDKFYNDFSGIKSYFFINNRIYALGSNITSDNKKYHVQTNLYQKVLKTKNTPTYADGRKVTKFPVADSMLDVKKPHYLLDTVGNGYFIPAGQRVFMARKHQKSRFSRYKKHWDSFGDFASAWLEHGVACKNAKYSYVIMPYCDREKLAEFSSRDYEILRQDDFAHILHDRIDNFYAGIFFKGGDVTKLPHVKSVERDCQIMYKQNQNSLELAVGDPDPHRNWTDKMAYGNYGGKSTLTPLKVTFAGAWRLLRPVNGVKVISVNNNKTVIEFACIHGKTFNFTLTKQVQVSF